MARYCPNCGTRLDPATAYSADEFETALADVLEAPVDETPAEQEQPATEPDTPAEEVPPIPVTTTSGQVEWTAHASDWTESAGQAGTWTAQTPTATTPAKPRGNRTMWIILAILGFVVFCCCGSFFALLLVAESDTALTNELPNMATLWI